MKTQDIKNMGQAWQMVQEGTKFEIPEEVPAQERTAFHGAAAAAHKAGKSHFTMNGKKYPVTMKKDTAKAISDDTKKVSEDEVVMNPKKDKKEKAKADVDCDTATTEAKVDEISKDKVGRYIKKAMVSTSDAGMDTASQDKDIRKRGINTFVKRRMGTSDAVRKLTGKARVPATEDTNEWPIYKRIMEKASHTAGAAEAEPVDSKDSPTAKKMRDDAKAKEKEKITDYDDLGHDDASKAGRAGPSRKMRNGDNQAGDKMEKPSDTTKG